MEICVIAMSQAETVFLTMQIRNMPDFLIKKKRSFKISLFFKLYTNLWFYELQYNIPLIKARIIAYFFTQNVKTPK
jgi:hypothetical protein